MSRICRNMEDSGKHRFHGGREKGERELCRKIEIITKYESAGVEGGRVKEVASKTASGGKNIPERVTYDTQLARGMDIVPHRLTDDAMYNKIKGLLQTFYRHTPPFAGFSTRQISRGSLTCTT